MNGRDWGTFTVKPKPDRFFTRFRYGDTALGGSGPESLDVAQGRSHLDKVVRNPFRGYLCF